MKTEKPNNKMKEESSAEDLQETKSEEPQQTQEEQKDPLAEMKDLLLRTQANFENYRKQNEKRMIELEKFAAKKVIMEIIPIIDNLQLALQNISANEDFVKGVELIYQQLQSLLEKYDVKIIESVGKKYDPYYHEALMKIPSEEAEGTVIDEFQRGYTLHGIVLRHARVKISAGKNETKNG